MNIKEYFKNKRNVATFTFILIITVILTLCIATSHSRYVLEKELKFDLEIIESEAWSQTTLITEELNEVGNTYAETEMSSEDESIDTEEKNEESTDLEEEKEESTDLVEDEEEKEESTDLVEDEEEKEESTDLVKDEEEKEEETTDLVEDEEEKEEESTDLVKDEEEKVEETTEGNIEDNGAENTVTE